MSIRLTNIGRSCYSCTISTFRAARLASTIPSTCLPQPVYPKASFIPPSKLYTYTYKKNSHHHLVTLLAASALALTFSHSMCSNDKEFSPTRPTKDLHSLGGIASVVDLGGDLVRYLQNYSSLSSIKPPEGVILSGPPGVGKTLFAEAVAGHAGVHLFLISSAELTRKYVGGSEKAVRELFEAVEKNAPCVLCLDEIDAIAPPRTKVGEALYHVSIVDQLLTLLSKERPGVVVIATTNHLTMVDPAVIRPGRLGTHLVLSPPSLDERKEILIVHLKSRILGSDVSLKTLAALSSGFTGAQLASWVEKAFICSTRRESSVIEAIDFEEARTLIIMGVRDTSSIDPKIKADIALHEAGHAIVGHLLGRKLYKVTIRAHGESLGYVEWVPTETRYSLKKEELLNHICTCLAGRAAELVTGGSRTGNKKDLDQAKELALKMVYEEAMGDSILLGTPAEAETILAEQLQRAISLISTNQKIWEQLRATLLEREELLEKEFLTIISGKALEKRWVFWDNGAKSKAPTLLPPPPSRLNHIPLTVVSSAEVLSNSSKTSKPVVRFSIAEVAKAINVSASSIREIQIAYDNGYEIIFKPSFERSHYMETVSTELKKHDVENIYLGFQNTLHIYRRGATDFEKYVQERNAE